MKQFWIAIPVMALVLLGAAACSSAQQGATPQGTAAQPTAAAPGAGVLQSPEAEKSVSQEPTNPTGESISLGSRDVGLDKLKSYRLRWQSQWNTTEGGKTQTANWDWNEEFSSSPEALHWTWKSTDVNATNQSGFEAWQIGDTTYMVTSDQNGQASCVSFSTADASQRLGKGLFSPKSLGSLSDARYVGNETVNGISSKHFQYDDKAVALSGLSKVSGDVWVAADGGYVVKDNMHWEGNAGLFGSSATGTGTGQWLWELSEVNQPIAITPPENCGGAAGTIPVMPDAKEKSSVGDMVIYKTESTPAQVVDFYKQQMAAAGWKLEGEQTVTEGFATLTFTLDSKKAQVSITSQEGQTNVIVNVTKE
jgi:hypothetical protein